VNTPTSGPKYPRALSVAAGTSRTTAISWPGAGADQRRIRILVFLEGRNIEGAVKPVLEFAREAAREAASARGFELTFVLYVRRNLETLLYRTLQERSTSIESVKEGGPWDPRVIPQLREIAQRYQPDIIWTNNTKSHLLVRLSGLHRKAKWLAVHQGYTKEAWRTRIYNQFDRWSHPAADRVVTVCNDFVEQLKRRGVSSHQIRLLHNPIRPSAPVPESEKLRLRKELSLADKTLVLLSVGRLSKEKGHADLLRAVAKARSHLNQNTKLLMVGDGPERSKLEKLSSELDLGEMVQFIGFRKNVRSFFAIADAFILPSHSEGSPNVLLEALDAGVAIVATAVGGVPEIVKDQISALLVPSRDVSGLSEAIVQIVNQPVLRSLLSTSGQAVIQRHSPQQYFASWARILSEL
jgi:glycosyltransferase involved in cell wall biosynthesis